MAVQEFTVRRLQVPSGLPFTFSTHVDEQSRQVSLSLFISTMENNSAKLGDPPSNQDDFLIVRGILRSAGLVNENASKGWVTVVHIKPADYGYGTKQPGIVAGMVVVIVLITFVTAARLALRYFSKSMRFESDDWVILIAAVSSSVIQMKHGHGILKLMIVSSL